MRPSYNVNVGLVDFWSGQNGGLRIVHLGHSDKGVRKGYELAVVEQELFGCRVRSEYRFD